MSVMDEYIKIVQDAITKYLKLVFERKFNKQICDSYIKTYIDVRYYNVNERGNHRTLRKEILESLKEKKKRLIVDNKSKQLLIENMEMFFIYVLYIDKVTPYKTIDYLVKNICRLRVKILKKEDEKFRKLLKDLIEELREFKHDLKNYLLPLQEAMETMPQSEMVKVWEKINQKIEDVQKFIREQKRPDYFL